MIYSHTRVKVTQKSQRKVICLLLISEASETHALISYGYHG